MTKNPKVAQPGIVQYIVGYAGPGEPESPEIAVERPSRIKTSALGTSWKVVAC